MLQELTRGADEATTREYLSSLARLPGVAVEGWSDTAPDTPLKFSYRLQIGDVAAYVRVVKPYRTKSGPWQLSARPYL